MRLLVCSFYALVFRALGVGRGLSTSGCFVAKRVLGAEISRT